MNDYRILVRNRQGATEIQTSHPNHASASRVMNTWADVENLQVEIYNDLGRCIGTKDFGKKRITWIGH